MRGRTNSSRGLAALRRLVARAPAVERCELCAVELSAEHQHLADPDKRRILCACDACAILFDQSGVTRLRRIPRDIRALPGFEIDNALWNSLAIPIGLVFLFRSSVSGAVFAVYPSPGGPAEIAIEADVWQELASRHPSLENLPEEVEALLIHRMNGARDYFIVPIDECYRLTGLIRKHWSGLTGGDELFLAIDEFFDSLKHRARPEPSVTYA